MSQKATARIPAWVCVLSLTCALCTSAAEELPSDATILTRGAQVGPPVTPLVFYGDVRDLPAPRPWEPGDLIRVVPQRFYTEPGQARPPSSARSTIDVLLERQLRHPSFPLLDSSSFTSPSRNFDGLAFTGAVPPDSVGDVGPSHYIEAVNGVGGAQVRVFDKIQPVPHQLATFSMQSLSGGSCPGIADPIVLHDRQANRWLLAEIATAQNSVCVYISQTANPVSGGWFAYEFVMPGLPDYPKFGVWATDANGGAGSYVVVTNEGDPSGVYALDRGKMLIGAAATSQRLTVPRLASSGIPAPADSNGPDAPPSGAPAILLRQRDTELNAGPPAPGDLLEMWLLDVDWIAPVNTTLTSAPSIDVAECDSDLCGQAPSCFAQPGGAPALWPLHWLMMHRLEYTNHGAYRSLIGNFTVDVNGLDRGGIRWFELRSSGGPWTLYQEGTYSLDDDNRWLGSIASDLAGNIALGLNVVSPTTNPGLRYTGRRSFDSSGVMAQTETVLAPGTDAENSDRYGDYAAMSLDPSDDCTFWFAGEYSVVNKWQTRIASFRFENCPCNSPPLTPSVQVTTPAANRIDVGWNDSGSSTVGQYLVRRSFTSGGPYTTIATVADTSPGVGGGPSYVFQDTGVSGAVTYHYIVTALDQNFCPSQAPVEASATATGSCVLGPSFGGVQSATSGGATCSIHLTWSAATARCGGPVTYDIYRSTTPGFVPSPQSLLAAGVRSTEATDANGLVEGVDYYYVVRAVDQSNGVNDGNAIYRRTTASGITLGGTQTFLMEDFEAPDVLTSVWTVGTGPGPHFCGEWQRVNLPAHRPSGGSGFYARALSQGCSATSTFLDSPVIDMSSPEIETVTLVARLGFAELGSEQATVEAWNGSAWQVISPNWSSVNGTFALDATAQAAGNPQFRVRFNYQNAVNADHYSVDAVSLNATLVLGSACTTSSGVAPVPDGIGTTDALTAARMDAAGDSIEVLWDATSCPAPSYNLLYGSLSGVATTTLDGSACGIGTGSFEWTSVPAGDLFFLVVGFDGNDVESRWGDATTGERNGLTASGQCGATLKSVTLTCP